MARPQPPVIPLTPAQQQLAEDNIAFAYFMANKSQKRSIMEYDDLIATCLEGLARAARDFDPSKGIRFTTFAGIVIPNWLDKQQRRLQKRYGREFSLEEYMQFENTPRWEERISGKERPLDDAVIEPLYTLQALQNVMPQLTGKERAVLATLTINPGISQATIGELIGVSQVQVSRIIKKIRTKIQEQMQVAV